LARFRKFDSLPVMNHWLVKQEPSAYSWDDLVREGSTEWTGVRNYQARNNLSAMRRGDRVLFYHSVTGKAVVGVARVITEAHPDPTAPEGDWVCVTLAPLGALRTPVTLDAIKAEPALADIPLIKQSRLSVMPLPAVAFDRIVGLGGGTQRLAGGGG
jgi:predicted RNA-binding protein with PUA-like domain